MKLPPFILAFSLLGFGCAPSAPKTTATAQGDAMRELLDRARAGDADTQLTLARRYFEGQLIARDIQEGQRWLEAAAAQSNLVAMAELATALVEGNPIPMDKGRGVELLKGAAALGHAPAQFRLGNLYAQGSAVAQDSVEAYKWHSLAAANGDLQANRSRDEVASQFTTNQLLNGVERSSNYVRLNVKSVRPSPNVDSLRERAGKGEAEAQFALGNACLGGWETPQNHVDAFTWFRRAADQAHLEALCVVGEAYHVGRWLPKSDTEAIRYLRNAAELGHANGQFLMGMLLKNSAPLDISGPYRVGALFSDSGATGIPLRIARFRQTEAKQNLQIIRAHAQILMAEFSDTRRERDGFQAYDAGLSVDVASRMATLLHYQEAYKWFILAASQGHQGAAIPRDALVGEQQLPQDLIAKAQQAAASFIPLVRPDVAALELKASEGDSDAQYRLAYCLFRGLGVAKDVKQFASWCQKASSNGHAKAQALWGAFQLPIGGRHADLLDLLRFNGEGTPPTQAVRAEQFEPLKLILIASIAGDSQARDLFGNFKQSLSPSDLSEIQRRAALWRSAPAVEAAKRQAKTQRDRNLFEFRSKRATEGIADAQYDLATQFLSGEGTPKDQQKGREWLEKAAAQGHAKAKAALQSLPSSPPLAK